MKRLRALGVLVLSLCGFGLAAVPPAQAKDFQSCNGVWVVVDYGDIGGEAKASCATNYTTGTAALTSAGFAVSVADGFVDKIAGKPAKPDSGKAYWSYWHATVKADGTYTGWTYSQLGAAEYHPTKGNAEGWHYISLSDSAAGPGIAPPDNPVASPSPTPSATSKSPKPTATATKSSIPTASASATKSASQVASATPTPTPPGPTPSAHASGPTAAATPGDAGSTAPVPTDTGAGGPVGLIVAAVVILGGGGGLGLWWYLRGRKR